MFRILRYLVMVRRTIWMLNLAWISSWIFRSESGFLWSSFLISSSKNSFIAAFEVSSSKPVAKKFLSATVPLGELRYLFAIALEMVEGLRPSSSARSFSFIGFMSPPKK